MSEDSAVDNPELDKLFAKYRESPEGFIFAPLADACRKAGLLEEAIEICANGLKLHPDYSSGHVVMGKCYYDKEMREKALGSFKKVLSLDPENLVALKYVGMIFAEEGDKEGAVRHFKRILTLDPNNREIKEKMQKLAWNEEEVMELREVEDEDFEGAEISLGEEHIATSDELATVTLADIFASQGYKEKAIRIYKEVLAKDPDNRTVIEKLRAMGEDVSAGKEQVSKRSDAKTAPAKEGKKSFPLEGEWNGSDTSSEEQEIDYEEELDSILEGEPVKTERRPETPKIKNHKDNAKRQDAGRSKNEAAKPRLIDEKTNFEHFKRWLKKAGE